MTAITVNDLYPVALEAREKTEIVARCAEKPPETIRLAHVVLKTLGVKCVLFLLVKRQERLISNIVDSEISAENSTQLTEFAASIDSLVLAERGLLTSAQRTSSLVVWWWRKSLKKLADQADYLESISESLHVSTDPECISLLAIALEEVAVRQ